ncbi:hypothetical protein [Microcoleus sp. bin38.metabat.b11b12b14.051]|uniref:hypothetical protein n=1 Tax=Microcoleus sp. bin38.metabat.b11b12b14.051 TaxID=2742709 RepID=UPI0025E3AD3C|nr:hypothetical protein [Microcoleus sp. bin38.metabat.b11b12b14.051]
MLVVRGEGRRKKEEGRRKKEEGRRKKEEGRRKKEEARVLETRFLEFLIASPKI